MLWPGQAKDRFSEPEFFPQKKAGLRHPIVTLLGKQAIIRCAGVLNEYPCHSFERNISIGCMLICGGAGGVPKVGDSISVGKNQLQIEAMDHFRIARLRVERIEHDSVDLHEDVESTEGNT
jgi:hypothetical protein